MQTATKYFYMDEPVEIHGTNDVKALIEVNDLLVAVPIENLDITKENKYVTYTSARQSNRQIGNEDQEKQENQKV